ncbi:MAG: hypothetical protein ACYC2K_02680 [Gemmatimonadales bacterium]
MVTFLLNVSLLFGALMSVQVTLGWGEAASYPLGGNKSSLAGFGTMIIVMLVRWLLLVGPLAVGAARGAFPMLPGGRTGQVLTAVTIHIVLGVISLQAFNWVLAAIQADNPGPMRLAWLPGLVLPIVVFGIAFWSINQDLIARRRWVAVVVFGLLIWAHWAGWRQGTYRPAPPTDTASVTPSES